MQEEEPENVEHLSEVEIMATMDDSDKLGRGSVRVRREPTRSGKKRKSGSVRILEDFEEDQLTVKRSRQPSNKRKKVDSPGDRTLEKLMQMQEELSRMIANYQQNV